MGIVICLQTIQRMAKTIYNALTRLYPWLCLSFTSNTLSIF